MIGWKSVGPDGDMERRMTTEEHSGLVGKLPRQTRHWLIWQALGVWITVVSVAWATLTVLDVLFPSPEPTLLEKITGAAFMATMSLVGYWIYRKADWLAFKSLRGARQNDSRTR